MGSKTKAEFRVAETFPVHEFFECIEIRRTWLESADQILAWRQRQYAALQHHFEFMLNLSNDRGQGRAAIARLVFDAIPLIRDCDSR